MKKTSHEAIASVICGIVSFFIFGWLSYCGFALGIIAIKNIRSGKSEGAAIAVIGIIISTVSMLVGILF